MTLTLFLQYSWCLPYLLLLFIFLCSFLVFILLFSLNFLVLERTLDIYSFDIFYIHVSAAIFCQLLFILILGFTFLFLLGHYGFYLLIVRQCLFIICSLYCLISISTGEFWSIATWGTWAPIDSRFISLVFMFFIYLFLYSFVSYGILNGNKNFVFLSNWICLFISFNFPLIKYSVTWWNSLHMSSSIKLFYDVSVEQNYDLFILCFFIYILWFILLFFYTYKSLSYIYKYFFY